MVVSFENGSDKQQYTNVYYSTLQQFSNSGKKLLKTIDEQHLGSNGIAVIRKEMNSVRCKLKVADFWLRYFEPTIYKKINGPLPVEWETEVFEKFEKPYKREGAGLTLAWLYLEERNPVKDSLKALIGASLAALQTYTADSITAQLNDYHHFYLCNRLFLLNLAAIYTTGFECPDGDAVVTELRMMLTGVERIYAAYNASFPDTPLPDDYLHLYKELVAFVAAQPDDYQAFNHFRFIRDYVNPLFAINQQMIKTYKVYTRNLVDYSLNKNATSIFDKNVYNGQNTKGVFLRVKDSAALVEIDRIGKLLFYDPILSGNNQRSCASCHKPTEFFTDTIGRTAFQTDHKNFLKRNTPSLINAPYNHLMMADGAHYTLQHQIRAVITNPEEMNCSEQDVLRKVLSCKEYKDALTMLLAYTPQESQVSFEHIASAVTYYYSKYSSYYAPFDEAINKNGHIDDASIRGFNLFMGKAQCATCHFVPQFNGVKPPYIGSEFEVLGVPATPDYRELSNDIGRYNINPAVETMRAFRTNTVRNSGHTMPYMHNGVFRTMKEVIDFYDAGGGSGHGLMLGNQTLAADSLRLTPREKDDLITFIGSLNEKIVFEQAPKHLPSSRIKALNKRMVGGEY